MGVDIFRKTSGVVLPKEVSQDIWGKTLKESAIMAATRHIQLPGPGITIPTITGDVEAKWVNETDKKPVSRPTFGAKDITPYKLAVIVPFSDEFARDANALYNECARRLPNALSTAFDKTVMGAVGKPGDNFDTLADAPKVPVKSASAYADMVKAYSGVAANDAKVSAWLGTPAFQALLMGATDTSGRPLFVPSATDVGEIGRFFGRPIYDLPNGQVGILGIAGDFENAAVFGTVEGVKVDIAREASLTDTDGTQINLWERNMFALRAEIEVGFRVRDLGAFVQLTTGTTTTGR
ncbi:phage major capsid protein [Actinotignum urinale]|uniref:phage major capsid protein n=1 Tax=Actinotignum urinale TaxID=190146 RepID=UPI0003B362BA|nr:phage major capsid protein [Actinotignum urinale]MDY5159564.1 phage major capsid protein [Actinotignum urinale]